MYGLQDLKKPGRNGVSLGKDIPRDPSLSTRARIALPRGEKQLVDRLD